MFQQRVGSLDEVLTLPAATQRPGGRGLDYRTAPNFETFRSVDGTERYLVAGDDGQTVETVWMPGGDGAEQGDDSAAGPPSGPPSVSPARLVAPSTASSA